MCSAGRQTPSGRAVETESSWGEDSPLRIFVTSHPGSLHESERPSLGGHRYNAVYQGTVEVLQERSKLCATAAHGSAEAPQHAEESVL